jgi:hypothetical protein
VLSVSGCQPLGEATLDSLLTPGTASRGESVGSMSHVGLCVVPEPREDWTT